MTGFQHYARFYDLLYADKPYQKETAYIRQLFDQYGKGISRILDAGCGTGLHAVEFVESGYKVTGLDQSADMIRLAQARKAELSPADQNMVEFVKSSFQSYRSPKPVDAVTALFHVMSYQTTGKLLVQAIQSAASNLEKGGLFVFDFWHTPGVLAEPPTRRTRTVSDGVISAKRSSVPSHDLENSLVKVDFILEIRDKATECVELIEESHLMRHFIIEDLESALEQGGFSLLNASGWLETTPPTVDNWYACITALKN